MKENDSLDSSNNDNYDEIINEGLEKLFALFDPSNSSNWKNVGMTKGVFIQRKDPKEKENFVYAFKGYGEIEASAIDIKVMFFFQKSN